MTTRHESDRAAPPIGPEEFDAALKEAWNVIRGWLRRLPPWVDRGAYEGEGLLALAQARHGYRPECGVPFANFACRQVWRALLTEARRQDPVSKRRRALLRRGAVQASAADQAPLSVHSLTEQSLAGGSPWGAGENAGPEEAAIARAQDEAVMAAVRALSLRERQVVRLRYWGDQTQASVAHQLGVSRVRVSQIERGALGTLRQLLEEQLPHELTSKRSRGVDLP